MEMQHLEGHFNNNVVEIKCIKNSGEIFISLLFYENIKILIKKKGLKQKILDKFLRQVYTISYQGGENEFK